MFVLVAHWLMVGASALLLVGNDVNGSANCISSLISTDIEHCVLQHVPKANIRYVAIDIRKSAMKTDNIINYRILKPSYRGYMHLYKQKLYTNFIYA